MRFKAGLLALVLLAVTRTNGQNGTATTEIPPKNVTLAHLHIETPQPQLSTLGRLQEKLQNLNISYNKDDYASFKNQTPNSVEITSKNYPKPYPAKGHESWNIVVENSTGIELVLHFLDIDPKTDYLKIHLGEAEPAEDYGLILTGKLNAPLQLRSLHSPKLQIEFDSNSVPGHLRSGFLLTYIPYGEIREPSTKPQEDVTIAPDDLNTFSILLSVPEQKQNNETWNLMRIILCEAANNYTSTHNLTLEECQSSNVKFISIVKCPNLWPNNLNCVEITFAIRLYSDSSIVTTEDPLYGEQLEVPKEFSGKSLKLIWDEFGQAAFKANNFLEYKTPETNGLIFFWAGMAIAAVLVFMLILVIISRLRVLRDYVKWPHADEDNQNILKKSQDIDITMFPSPHQVVPTLFPTSTSAYSPGSSFLYGGDVYENRPRDLTEHFIETDPSLFPGLRRKSSFEMDSSIMHMDPDDKNRSHQQESYVMGTTKDDSNS